ncbi:chemotaxis protein CheX [Zooshikella harenae]|uniref:Chemotaxis protein CheX n=1 Tax=Zooshikella harenae TaxID=2827238 RepID=A0ABS5ZBH0_9GAMM|nr:chemotaxis protein CheX [Zooshikella harenae]MBU2711325.1 chemotaxis protein CheX [Zooshikella harenae]
MTKPVDIGHVMALIANRAKEILVEEASIEVQRTDFVLEDVQLLTLRDYTSILSMGGPVNMMIAFSFDMSLLHYLMNCFMSGIEFPPEEKEVYLEETGSDLLNTIIGNCTALLGCKELVHFSPPVAFSGGKSLVKHRHAQFYRTTLQTQFGDLVIICVGPKDMFDQYLNYLE